ncbi:Signal peptidase I T [bacterium HR34]|nr:Signal peptidase I T [bacterium HR34]
MKSAIKEYIKIGLLVLLIVVPIRYFIFQPFLVQGSSMEPNFESGDYLIVDEISYRFSDPKRGDVIIFNSPVQPVKYIKRVIGLPGETVKIENGKVYIKKQGNNEFKLLQEPYTDIFTEGRVEITLKEGEYFVMGDNRFASYDSRSWGVLKRNKIIGRVLIRLWPISKIDIIENPFNK